MCSFKSGGDPLPLRHSLHARVTLPPRSANAQREPSEATPARARKRFDRVALPAPPPSAPHALRAAVLLCCCAVPLFTLF